MKTLLVLMLAGLLGPAAVAQTNLSAAPDRSTAPKTPAPAKLLRDDPLLQQPVTIDAVEHPLGNVLAALNPALKLDLTAEQNVADQRVTLHIAGQPVYVLMNQLLLLLSHNSEHPYGYHWGSLDRIKGERPDYQLWRDTASLAQEQQERDRPRHQLAIMLRDMRRDSQLPAHDATVTLKNVAQQTINADDPYNKALRDLTDEQLDALVNEEIVFLDPALDTADVMDTAAHPAIQVIPADEDFDADYLDRAGQFDLCVGDVVGGEDLAGKGARILDTNSIPKDPDPESVFLSLPADAGAKIDLAPYLAAKTVTPQQKANLGFNLQALGRAAHLSIYGESFLQPSVQNVFPPPGLTSLQGSVPRLVAEICAAWNYHAYPVPGGYLFWSRTWAQDRARDVPERLLAPWQARLKKNGTLGVYDRAEIDSALTWPQVALTANPALFPSSSDGDEIYAYRELNLFGSLTPSEQAQALSPDGLAVSEMSARGQGALTSDFQKRLASVPGDQLMQSALHFQIEDAPELDVRRLIMEVGAGGQRLLETRCIMPLQAGEIGKPVKVPEATPPASD